MGGMFPSLVGGYGMMCNYGQGYKSYGFTIGWSAGDRKDGMVLPVGAA